MPQEMTWRKAIETVMTSSATPLHYREITERIIAQKLRTSLGATPSATVYSLIFTSIKNEGGKSPFLRVAKGTYAMRTPSAGVTVVPAKLTPDVAESEEHEEQYEIVTSFGMFWRRSDVEWVGTPKLLGMQDIGAIPVDFNKQLGIYLLYDGREVIYVGRSTDRPLGRRLYEHTIDRMSTRWDRFSWFGLLPVSDTGQLGSLPNDYQAATIIPALEAILIEAMETPQNRKRGDDLEAVEYVQYVDPEIKKRQMKAMIDKL